MSQDRGSFGRLGFVLAAAGSAIGLGNIWKFPYMTYDNQGGSFVLVYLLAVIIVGLPIMMAEIVIGRSTNKSPVSAFLQLHHPAFSIIGWLGVVTGFVILSYYSVVAGWTVHYFIKGVYWSVQGFTSAEAATLGDQFGAFISNPSAQIGYHALFMGFSVMVVIFGVKGGIERLTKILMPVLLLILLSLVIVSMWSEGFTEAMGFLFRPSKISPDSLLEAVGHAFFTLSLGMGAIITYGSYMTKKESIPRSAAMVCLMDTLIALMACVVMFSLIYSVPAVEREQFSSSIGVMFTTLPKLFYGLPGGIFLAPLFYILVAFAALTSTISLLEVVVAFFIDQLNWHRVYATLVMGLTIFAFGILSALSLGALTGLSAWQPLGDKSKGVFDTLDYLASNWFLPVGGILIAIFVGWVLPKVFSRKEVEKGHGSFHLHGLWIFLLRFVAPAAIGWIVYSVIFLGKSYN
ncbi:sodium-dependent transporter [bacterium]|nr:sodium-dependent transporter [bacterium]